MIESFMADYLEQLGHTVFWNHLQFACANYGEEGFWFQLEHDLSRYIDKQQDFDTPEKDFLREIIFAQIEQLTKLSKTSNNEPNRMSDAGSGAPARQSTLFGELPKPSNRDNYWRKRWIEGLKNKSRKQN